MSAATVMCVDLLSFASSSVGILRERLDVMVRDSCTASTKLWTTSCDHCPATQHRCL